jgi:hypothetical protein
MAEHGWKTFGMRMIILEGHINVKGEPVYATYVLLYMDYKPVVNAGYRYDFNTQLGNPAPGPFIEGHLDPDTQVTLEADWSNYAHAAFRSSGHGNDNSQAMGTSRAPTMKVEFERDEYDLPILPQHNASMKTDEINTLIRSFLGIHYGMLPTTLFGLSHHLCL